MSKFFNKAILSMAVAVSALGATGNVAAAGSQDSEKAVSCAEAAIQEHAGGSKTSPYADGSRVTGSSEGMVYSAALTGKGSSSHIALEATHRDGSFAQEVWRGSQSLAGNGTYTADGKKAPAELAKMTKSFKNCMKM